ncbi:MAG TPA: hypothetical protein VGQ57_03880, partial [Polyangiaceae bacterium]|nr:hypothetical protein [Polyangiaceae bacterium]
MSQRKAPKLAWVAVVERNQSASPRRSHCFFGAAKLPRESVVHGTCMQHDVRSLISNLALFTYL